MDVNEIVLLNISDKEQKPPDFKNFSKICRTCLKVIADGDAQIKTIHDDQYHLNLRSLIEVYTFVKIPDEDNDELPQNLCSNCVDFLVGVHTFRCKCKINDDLLRRIKKNEKEKQSSKDDNNEIEKPVLIQNELTPMERISSILADEKLGKHSCKSCFLHFNDRISLVRHAKEAKHKVKLSACPYCGELFTSFRLKHHMLKHTKEKPFACDICSYRTRTKFNLRLHIRNHTGEKPYVCEICGKGFSRGSSFQKHGRWHKRQSENPAFNCKEPDCGKICKTEYLLKKHMTTHMKNSQSDNNLCYVCGRRFSTQGSLTTHMRTHTGKKFGKCPICDKTFTHKAAVKPHMLIHEGKKPHTCNFCNRAFRQLSQLTYHLRIHTKEKPYECEFCGHRFAIKGNLTVHRRTHTGETPYRCTVCAKGFYDSSSCRRHQRGHSEDEIQQSKEIQEEIEQQNNENEDPKNNEHLKVEFPDESEFVEFVIEQEQ